MTRIKKKPLTARQQQVLDFIAESVKKRGYPPTVREIGQLLGIVVNGASRHLDALERKGHIVRDPGVSRGIRLV
jgi:repressor LexA